MEQVDRLLELAGEIEVATEKVVELGAHRGERRILEVLLGVGADLLQDSGKLGEDLGERGEPLQRPAEVFVGRPLLHDAVEVDEGGGVELEVKQRLAEEELGLLLVGLRVLVALHHLVELDRARVVVALVVELLGAFQRLGRRAGPGHVLRLDLDVFLSLRLGLVGRRMHRPGRKDEHDSDDRQASK